MEKRVAPLGYDRGGWVGEPPWGAIVETPWQGNLQFLSASNIGSIQGFISITRGWAFALIVNYK